MSKIRKIQFLICLVFIALVVAKTSFAQQDPMYTQYIDNLQVVNPGFAGSKETGSVLLVSRNQWVSITGAPITRSFSYNTIVNNKVGIGVSVMHDKIGPLKQTGVYFDYSYFLRVSDDYKLGMGLKGGVNFYRAALSELVTVDPDPIYTQDIYKNFLPNLGVGLFLYSDYTYFGLSVPKLIENTISRDDYQTEYLNRQQIHVYAVAGKNIHINEYFQVKVNGMLKYVRNAPVSLQINSMVGFRERFWLGGMVRFGDAFGVMTQFQATKKIIIGYSYDILTSELSVFSNGTHEISFGYNFNVF